jgi:hypothetical protein
LRHPASKTLGRSSSLLVKSSHRAGLRPQDIWGPPPKQSGRRVPHTALSTPVSEASRITSTHTTLARVSRHEPALASAKTRRIWHVTLLRGRGTAHNEGGHANQAEWTRARRPQTRRATRGTASSPRGRQSGAWDSHSAGASAGPLRHHGGGERRQPMQGTAAGSCPLGDPEERQRHQPSAHDGGRTFASR